VRRMTLTHLVDRVRQDLEYAWRGLRRAPGFTAMVVATLALGIGVNGAMFAFLDRVFVRAPSGVGAPREVRRLYIAYNGMTELRSSPASDNFKYPHFRAIAATDSTLEIAAFTPPDSTSIVQGDLRVPIRRSRVTGAYFSTLRVRPQLGRFFVDEER